MDALVSPQWLLDARGAADLKILDATWFLPDAGRDARAEFEHGHIPGAVFFDINAIADPATALPTMLPSADQFARQLGELGVGPGDRIILYDDAPHRTAARAWWMLRAHGITASLLDGGFAAWREHGFAVESGPASASTATPGATPGAGAPARVATRVQSLETVQQALASSAVQLADARSPARFSGAERETRPGLFSGHIPGSVNTHYARFFEPDGRWKAPDALKAIFADAGIDIDRPVIATCGSGISAAVIVFALYLLGKDASLYDGSWTQWGAHPDTPKATGAV